MFKGADFNLKTVINCNIKNYKSKNRNQGMINNQQNNQISVEIKSRRIDTNIKILRIRRPSNCSTLSWRTCLKNRLDARKSIDFSIFSIISILSLWLRYPTIFSLSLDRPEWILPNPKIRVWIRVWICYFRVGFGFLPYRTKPVSNPNSNRKPN